MTEAVAAVPESGALSIDQAIQGLLSMDTSEAPSEPSDAAPEPETEEVEEPEQHEDSEAEPTAEDLDAAETPSEEEPAETPEPELPVIEPPPNWDAEDKATFAELPRHLQEKLVERDKVAVKATAQAMEEAATIRKAAESEIAQVKGFAAQLTEFLPKAQEIFQSRWGDQPIDWLAVQREYGTEKATELKFQYERDQDAMQRLTAAKRDASNAARQVELREEAQLLAKIAPHLTDPKEGLGRRQALAGWLLERGAPPEQVENIGALATVIAWEAFQASEAHKTAAARITPPAPKPATPKPVQAKPVVKPSAVTPAVPTQQRTAQQAMNRFAQTRTVDDAAAAILALSKG